MSQPPTGEHHTSRLPESSESPDFLVRRGEHGFYVEALTVFSGIVDERRHGAREAEVLDAIEGLEKGRFFLGVNFERVGSSSPRRTVMRRHLETWLAGLDPDKLEADAERGLPYPSTIIEAGDWVLDVAAFPIAREHRGAQDQPVIGIGPLMAGTVNDHEKIGAALRRKRSRYRQARKPLVLALLSMSTFFESQHVERLLFGTTAAYFSGSGLLTHQALDE